MTQVSGQMDCATTPAVPAHGIVTVKMHINVPSTAGNAKFVWWITGLTVGAGEGLTIAPAA